MQRALRRLRARAELGEDGFTIFELVMALAILSVTVVTLSYGLYGGMGALSTIRTRSAFQDLVTGELEKMRGLEYDDVGVNADDANKGAEYPSNQFAGRDMVELSPPRTAALPARESVAAAVTNGVRLPAHVIHRHVTWTDPSAGTTHVFKRLQVSIDWVERTRTRSVSLESVLYPGGIGPATGGAGPAPTARFAVSTTDPPCALPCASPAGFIEYDPPGTEFYPATVFTVDATSLPNQSFDSTVPPSLPLSYDWDWGDSSLPGSGGVATHTYTTTGTKTIKLVVTNAAGIQSAPATIVVNVGNRASNPPTAVFTVSTTGPADSPLAVNVLTNTSSDPDPGETAALTFDWDWGDGTLPHATGTLPSHVYTAPGSHTLRLTVRDPGGLTGSAQVNIVVQGPGCLFVLGGSPSRKANLENHNIVNDIELVANGANKDQAKHGAVDFFAFTNIYCNSVTAKVPLQGGSVHTFNLSPGAVVSGVKSWSGSGNFGSDLFNNGTQTQVYRADGNNNFDTFSPSVAIHY